MQNAMGLMKCYTVRLKNFWISLLGLASVTILVWWVNPIEDMDLYPKVFVTLLCVVYPVLNLIDGFMGKQQDPKVDLINLMLTAFFSFFLGMELATRPNTPAVVINVFLIIVSLPPLWVLWDLTKGKWLLLFATVLLIIVTSFYLVPPITPEGLTLDYLLVPLPFASYLLIVWALVARRTLTLAQRWKWCPVWGPLTESLTMLLIAAPLVALTMLAANAMGFGDIGVAVFGVIAGILFGNAVSTPLRQFLLALGGLSQCRCEGGHKGLFMSWL